MKNNLMKALILSLDYEIKTYSTNRFSYKAEITDGEISVVITVKASDFGSFHGLQSIYSLFHERLCSHANIKDGNLVITVF